MQSDSTATLAHRRRHRRGALGVALAFTTALAFSTVPTPLWSLYAQRDGLSSLLVTVIFAAYAVGVAVSLFTVGHLSDWHGRRRVLVPALLLAALSDAIFLLWPALPGLVAARFINGLGVGAVTATATAWLVELHTVARGPDGRRRAETIAVAANLGGLGSGALAAGLLATWLGHPLTVPFFVFLGALGLALVLALLAPETRPAVSPRPAYRVQHIAVPADARPRYFAAATGAAITFSIFGLLTSLAPSFLAGQLHQHSLILDGAVAFAGFVTAAVAQLASGSLASTQLLRVAIPLLLLGLTLLTLALWLPQPSLAMFLAGVVVSGAGSGLIFKGAVTTAAQLAPAESRAEAMAGVFLAAYLGLAGPVIGLGLLTQLVSVRVSLLAFAALLAVALLLASPWLLGRQPRRRRHLNFKPITQ